MMEQASLFPDPPSSQKDTPPRTNTTASENRAAEPLASRLRPRTLDEFVGQEHLLGEGRLLRRCLEEDRVPSLILWGPPGSGKTTLASLIAQLTRAHFVTLSAVAAGVADLRRVTEEARRLRQLRGERTILFIDEIHRLNKAQQDAILPYVEQGLLTLIGATTENPSFEVNAALLSRCRVFTLNPLSEEAVIQLLRRALQDEERGLGRYHLEIEDEALQQIARFSNGDARTALNVLELAAAGAREGRITAETVAEAQQRRALLYDKSGDQHYDTISALHKAIRGSDPDASLYWLARMLEAGEDPLFIARRLIRIATEDVGLADPLALPLCVAAQQAVQFVGLPEADLALAEAVVYLASAPKSNALYLAYGRARDDVHQQRQEAVPLSLRNAPTTLMKQLGYGRDYQYAHDYYHQLEETSDDPSRPPAVQLQEYLPANLQGRRYYEPGLQGNEASIRRWLERRRTSSTQSQPASPAAHSDTHSEGSSSITGESHSSC
ncbi:MAG: replication-associated recombination protein A [Thermogemmatispora sp.]|uniref:replication-associated recombination protein A n=1 Tax=Thermogemmatispora sp. TaxID=1968838 RepID=UPI001A0D8731|nr:replication-associated recombination protein A [Thermogemmatispora sp.]MBE3567934.1 replication-associated recombination protein A [Thermogemmatispora sp.]